LTFVFLPARLNKCLNIDLVNQFSRSGGLLSFVLIPDAWRLPPDASFLNLNMNLLSPLSPYAFLPLSPEPFHIAYLL